MYFPKGVVCMGCIFLVHWAVGKCLGWFHSLAIMNSDAMLEERQEDLRSDALDSLDLF